MSLSDVAEHIHIRAMYLEAIEEEDWPAIGAPVYVRGFLRTYARFLGIDPERAVEAFNQAVPSTPPTRQFATAAASTAEPPPRVTAWVWLAGLVAVALVAYVGYGYYQLRSGPGAAVATSSPVAAVNGPGETAVPASIGATPAESPTASPTPAPLPTRQAVSLRLTQVSWLRVTVDGNVVLEGEFPAGTVRDFHGKHVRVLAGNAGGVEIAAPGREPRVLGSPGEVVERDYALATKPATQQQ